jgi:lysozyme
MNKPGITRERVEELLKKHKVDLAERKVCFVVIEGYFLDTMGKHGKNDIGIYDDAGVWISSDGGFATFNLNTDPSRYYPNVATLDYGVWEYKKGKHGISRPGGGYDAFRQAAPVFVRRWQPDGSFKRVPLGDTINIHKGGVNGTSSAGCQTFPPAQWEAGRAYGYMLLSRLGVKKFPLLKVKNSGDIA